jgi:hypothetical protein
MEATGETSLLGYGAAKAWLEEQGGFWLVTDFDGARLIVVSAWGRSGQAVIEGGDERAAFVRAVWALRTSL